MQTPLFTRQFISFSRIFFQFRQSFCSFLRRSCAIEIQIILSSFSDFNPFWNSVFFSLAKSQMWEIINCPLFWATDHTTVCARCSNQLVLWVLTVDGLLFVYSSKVSAVFCFHHHAQWVNERVIWCVDLIWFDSIRIIISVQFSIGQLIIDK